MFKFAIIYFTIVLNATSGKINVKELKCLVCQATLDELSNAVSLLDPTITTEIGGFRLDSDGNLKQKTISQAKSELILSEIIDNICNKMDDYVRVTWKSNGTLSIMKMVTPDGGMNPNFSEVDFVQDDDLNKSLKYYCEGLMEEYEDTIVGYYSNTIEDIKTKVCTNDAKYCSKKRARSDEINEQDKDEL